MGINRWRSAFSILALAMLVVTTVVAQSSSTRRVKIDPAASAVQKSDTAGMDKPASFDDMARRVDSLQFIVVYNAELLQKDLGTKVMWIYVMLGAMIVASITMYSALKQAQRSREDLEGKLTSQLTSVVNHLEGEIKAVSDKVEYYHPRPSRRTPRKKT